MLRSRDIRGLTRDIGRFVLLLGVGLVALGVTSCFAGDKEDEAADRIPGDTAADSGEGEGEWGEGEGEGGEDWGEGEGEGAGEGEGEGEGEVSTDSDVSSDTATDTALDTSGTDSITDTTESTDTETASELSCDPTAEIAYFLSADDSNSMASPVVVRSLIESGQVVTVPIRTYEFLNYYRFEYAAPEAGHLTIVPEARAVETANGLATSIQIGVRAENRDTSDRRPLNLVFSLDTSGSMQGSPLQRLQAVCRAILGNLKDGDIVSIVKWSSDATVLLDSHAISGPSDPAVLEIINGLVTTANTNLYGGLLSAYELAAKNHGWGRMSRVVLVSDGGANAGVTEVELIADAAGDSNEEGIYLMGVGTGSGYNDTLMDEVTDKGKGAYVYVDSEAEAESLFGDARRFVSLVDIAARDVRLKVELPAGWYMEKFHGEQASTNPAEVDPQHLSPNDAMIFNLVAKTCDGSTSDEESLITVTASYRDPLTYAPKAETVSLSVAQMKEAASLQLLKGEAVVAYAESLKEVAKLLYGSDPEPKIALLEQALSVVEDARLALPEDPDLAEIAGLLRMYIERF